MVHMAKGKDIPWGCLRCPGSSTARFLCNQFEWWNITCLLKLLLIPGWDRLQVLRRPGLGFKMFLINCRNGLEKKRERKKKTIQERWVNSAETGIINDTVTWEISSQRFVCGFIFYFWKRISGLSRITTWRGAEHSHVTARQPNITLWHRELCCSPGTQQELLVWWGTTEVLTSDAAFQESSRESTGADSRNDRRWRMHRLANQWK